MKKYGTRKEVMYNNAEMRGGGLRINDLTYNKQGKIVSKKKSLLSKIKYGGTTNGILYKRTNDTRIDAAIQLMQNMNWNERNLNELDPSLKTKIFNILYNNLINFKNNPNYKIINNKKNKLDIMIGCIHKINAYYHQTYKPYGSFTLVKKKKLFEAKLREIIAEYSTLFPANISPEANSTKEANSTEEANSNKEYTISIE